jgi:hypothetical protein
MGRYLHEGKTRSGFSIRVLDDLKVCVFVQFLALRICSWLWFMRPLFWLGRPPSAIGVRESALGAEDFRLVLQRAMSSILATISPTILDSFVMGRRDTKAMLVRERLNCDLVTPKVTALATELLKCKVGWEMLIRKGTSACEYASFQMRLKRSVWSVPVQEMPRV